MLSAKLTGIFIHDSIAECGLKPRRKCIFDGDEHLITKEHFWPDWASDLLPRYQENQYMEESHRFTEIIKPIGTPKITKKNGNLYTKKIRVVCKSCNNGWMSKLEEAVKPILIPLMTSTPHVITVESSLILAQWITLKIMVGEANTLNSDDVVTTFDMREKFKTTLEIPANFHIWIAKCGEGGWQTQYYRDTATVSLTEEPPISPLKNIQNVTFGIGDLLIYIFHTTVPDFPCPFTSQDPGIIIPVYPILDSIKWPPRRGLSIKEADSLAGTLNRMIQNDRNQWQPFPS